VKAIVQLIEKKTSVVFVGGIALVVVVVVGVVVVVVVVFHLEIEIVKMQKVN